MRDSAFCTPPGSAMPVPQPALRKAAPRVAVCKKQPQPAPKQQTSTAAKPDGVEAMVAELFDCGAEMVTDSDGTPIVRMPLRSGGPAVELRAHDWIRLRALGVSSRWSASGAHGGAIVARKVGTGRPVLLARLIVQGPPAARIVYLDGNMRNLRWKNVKARTKRSGEAASDR